MPEATWTPYDIEGHGRLDAAQRNSLPDSSFAFSFSRKEPMTDAQHVRNAIARFEICARLLLRMRRTHYKRGLRLTNGVGSLQSAALRARISAGGYIP